MSFNKRLCAIIFLIILFSLLIVYFNNLEKFTGTCTNSNSFIGENVRQAGYFSVVNSDDNNEDSYDLDYEGPKCLATCVLEHGVNINFKNEDGVKDIFYWHNKDENIGRGYCFNANDDVFPYNCTSDNCQSKCERNNNSIENRYIPEEDFTQCKKDEKYGCIENEKLNFLTGVSAQTTTGCKECIQKYMPNLTSIMNILDDQIADEEKCLVD